MPYPSLIEFVIGDIPIYLVFQAKANPLLACEIHGQDVHPNKCPDDGTLFLEGQPEDYVGLNIWFDEGLTWMLVRETAEGMAKATSCAFGEVVDGESGGSGPGFTFAGGDIFYHDGSLGVSTDTSISEQMMGISSGIVVVIHRPDEYKVWKYWDENDPPPDDGPRGDAPAHEGEGQGEGDGADMEIDDQNGAEDPTNDIADGLAGRMKSLRLKAE